MAKENGTTQEDPKVAGTEPQAPRAVEGSKPVTFKSGNMYVPSVKVSK